MKRLLFALLLLLILPSVALAASATATWVDNSDNEMGFRLERQAAACTAPDAFTEIGTVGANIKTYVDNSVVVGVRYCYRVRAWNREYTDGTGNMQYSAYSNKGDFSLPLPQTVPPSGLGVVGTP